jgi:hypothetical protein
MEIRKVNINDANAVCKISRDDLGYNCDIELVKNRINELDDRREIVFVAVIDGNVVGYVHAEKFNTLYYKSMVNLQGLAVSSDYQRKGAGTALMAKVEEWAKDNNAKAIRLNSGFARKSAHEFYRALGYNNKKEQIRFMKEI